MDRVDKRSRSVLSNKVLAFFLLSFALQVGISFTLPKPSGKASELQPPPSTSTLKLIGLGESTVVAQIMTLYLQSFDTQPGVSIRYVDLDYSRVIEWLKAILASDPSSQYPLLMASHLYAQVPNREKQKAMLDFVYRQFLLDPNRRWQWLAHAAVVAKHKLKDLPLSLVYADAIAKYATSTDVPSWAKQMRIFILEDMGEIESAKVLLGGLIESGTVHDEHEIRFLTGKLKALEHAEKSSSPMGK